MCREDGKGTRPHPTGPHADTMPGRDGLRRRHGTGAATRARRRADGGPSANARSRDIASVAAVGFGLTGICVADGRGWVGHDEAYVRVLVTLRHLRDGTPNEHGFYYHFLDLHTGGRAWKCELSSI